MRTSALKIFDISEERYRRETEELAKLGYTQKQSDRIIIRLSSALAVNTLLELHGWMISQGLSHNQITRVASRKGGSRSLEAVQTFLNALRACGFTTEQVTRIAARDGGSKTLKAVWVTLNDLMAHGFTTKQITRIAAKNGGSIKLEDVRTTLPAMEGLRITTDKITIIAAKNGSSLRLNAIQEEWLERKEQIAIKEQTAVSILATRFGVFRPKTDLNVSLKRAPTSDVSNEASLPKKRRLTNAPAEHPAPSLTGVK